MIGEVPGSPQASLFAGMPDKQQRPARLGRCPGERFRHLENSHRARAIVVSTVEYRVRPRRPNTSQAVDVDTDRCTLSRGETAAEIGRASCRERGEGQREGGCGATAG